MDGRLVFAIVTITLALAFYTAGVWSERKSNTLKKMACNHLLDRSSLWYYWYIDYGENCRDRQYSNFF